MSTGIPEFGRLARRDIRGIFSYTRSEWGRAQADRYIGLLDDAFDRLATFPELGRERPTMGTEIRSFPVERHVIVYRVVPSGVLILRVIHQKMRLSDIELT